MKALLRFLVRILFRFTAENESVLRTPGPVLLIPNHSSWLDWLFLGVCLEDDWKFVVSSVTAQTSWLHRRIMLNRRSFPIDTSSPYAVKRMAEHLQTGGRLVLFAEGRISRSGTLMKLFEGTGFLMHKTGAKIITAYIRGANRLITSPNPNKKLWLPHVSTHFSDVLLPPRCDGLSTSAARARLTVWLRDKMVTQQFEVESRMGPRTVLSAVLEASRIHGGKVVLQDIQQSLSLRKVLAGVDILAEQIEKRLGSQPNEVGVLLPNVNATPICLLALWALGRIPAVLNFSTGIPVMKACAQLAGLKTILTSKAFLEKAKLNLQPLEADGIQLLYLEDLRAGISGSARLLALVRVWLNPDVVKRTEERAPSERAIVLFTSGSEGVPKGVALTQTNLMANIRQLLSVCDLTDEDRVFNCLPLFHSFGLTIGTLLPLTRGLYTFLYPSPLHYRVIPTVLYDRDCTVLLSTNTFLNGYARKADPYDFRSLRYLFAGAEKIQEATTLAWMNRFGVRILEGYGATECSPCLSINTPMLNHSGSVGRFLPAVDHAIEPVEGVAEGGRLLVRGPNIMSGYLNKDADAAFKDRGGWYDTGDIVTVDDHGFVFIRGRLKRFAKVSGEMVSLSAVEEALAGAFPHYGLRCQIAVVTQPDLDKGERLIAVTNEARLGLDEIRTIIRARGLSNLCCPREIRFIKEIPKLGTGKVNHRELEQWIRSQPAPPAA